MGYEKRCLTLFMAVLVLSLLLFLGYANCIEAQNSSIHGYVQGGITNYPVSGARVSLFQSGETTPFITVQTNEDGYYEIDGLSTGTYDVEVEADGYYTNTTEVHLEEGVTYNHSVRLVPKEDEEPAAAGDMASESFFLCFQTLVLIAVVLVISTVMYSKIRRENLLKHATRKRIYDYIEQNPGKHYRAILSDLDLPIGMLSYHINRLEKEQYIKSRQDGMYRRFYVPGRKTEMRFFLSEIQESILNVIKNNRGISQSKIAEKIGVSRKVVNYHINILDQAGLILVESRGRETACFPRDGGM